MKGAIESVKFIRGLMNQHSALRWIVIFVKKILAFHDLNKPFSGGLNSYSTLLMVNCFLRTFNLQTMLL